MAENTFNYRVAMVQLAESSIPACCPHCQALNKSQMIATDDHQDTYQCVDCSGKWVWRVKIIHAMAIIPKSCGDEVCFCQDYD